MAPSVIDPNNHVPDISPDDVWGDVSGLHAEEWDTNNRLPPKRNIATALAADSSAKPNEGLRIGPALRQGQSEAAGNGLEVQEILGNVIKLTPEIPTVTKVSAIAVVHRPPAGEAVKKSHRGESIEWGHSGKFSIRWMVALSLSIIGVVVLGLLALPMINGSNTTQAYSPQTKMVLDPTERAEGMESLNRMLALQPEAEQIFRSFARASVPEEILPFIRDAKTLEPLIRANPRPAMVAKDWMPKDPLDWRVFQVDGMLRGVLVGTLPDFSKFNACFVLAEKHLLLDWKATTGYGTATFEDLAKNQGNPAEIRGRITSAGYYTAAFPEAEYQSYKLRSPDNERSIWCYTRRGTQVAQTLGKLFAGGEILESPGEPQDVTVRLERGPAGALPNQWLAGGKLYTDWITP